MVYVRVVADVLIVANWVANFVLTSPPPAVAAVATPSIEVLRSPAAVQTCPAQVVCSIVGGVPEPVAEEGDVEAVVVLEVPEHAVNRTARQTERVTSSSELSSSHVSRCRHAIVSRLCRGTTGPGGKRRSAAFLRQSSHGRGWDGTCPIPAE